MCRETLLPASCALPVPTGQWLQGTAGRTPGWGLPSTAGCWGWVVQEVCGTASAKEKCDLGEGKKGHQISFCTHQFQERAHPSAGMADAEVAWCPILRCRSSFWKREKLLVESQGH